MRRQPTMKPSLRRHGVGLGKARDHSKRVSGTSGRTAGKMFAAANGKSKPSSERRKLRQKTQLQPMGDKNRFPNGKYFPMDPDPVEADDVEPARGAEPEAAIFGAVVF